MWKNVWSLLVSIFKGVINVCERWKPGHTHTYPVGNLHFRNPHRSFKVNFPPWMEVWIIRCHTSVVLCPLPINSYRSFQSSPCAALVGWPEQGKVCGVCNHGDKYSLLMCGIKFERFAKFHFEWKTSINVCMYSCAMYQLYLSAEEALSSSN